MNQTQEVIIYTDGSCNCRTKVGGYGVYFTVGDYTYVTRGGYTNTTTPRMEMRALLVALRLVNYDIDTRVTVKADSQFVVNAFRMGWLNQWRISGWTGVKNAALWKEIVEELDKHPKMKFNIEWLRGHQKDITEDDAFGNAVADELADYHTQDSYVEDTLE